MKIEELSINEIKSLVKEKNLLEFNRDIQDRHVDKMLRSIQKCGILRLPVVGDISSFDKRKRAIIDAQHLCTALTLMPKDSQPKTVPCIIKKYDHKREVIMDIAKLNNTQKTWSDADYLEAWVSYGKDNIEHYWNYHELNQIYNRFEGMPIGFLVDLFAKSKDGFKEGALVFRDSEFSMQVLLIANHIRCDFNKPAHTLHGLKLWTFQRHFQDKKEIDFKKLKSRLADGLRLGRDKNCNGREDFKNLIEDLYTKV